MALLGLDSTPKKVVFVSYMALRRVVPDSNPCPALVRVSCPPQWVPTWKPARWPRLSPAFVPSALCEGSLLGSLP